MPNWLEVSFDPDGEWTDAAHWSGGVPSAPGSIANFGIINSPEYEITFLETANISVGQMNFTGNLDVTFRGSYGDSGTDVADLFFDNGAAAAQLNMTGGGDVYFSQLGGLRATLVSNLAIHTAAAGDKVIFDIGMSGAGKIIKTGDGRLELNDVKTFTGGFDIQGGSVSVSSDASLGSGGILVSNNAEFYGTGAIDNPISTFTGATGVAGSARVFANFGETMTLTGVLYHLGQGTLRLGGQAGSVIAAFSTIFENATHSSYELTSRVQMGNAYNAANLLSFAGTGTTKIDYFGRLDTNGFVTTISNLDFDGEVLLNFAVIESTSGTLNLIVNDSSTTAIVHEHAAILGTGGADSIVVNILNDFNFTDVLFQTWTAGTDTITYNGSGNANVIIGTGQRETFNGGAGADTLVGISGIDIFNGGSGDDIIAIGGTSDGSLIDGGADNDLLRVTDGTVSVGSLAGIERVQLQTGATLLLSGAEFAGGLAFDTQLSGLGSILVTLSVGNQQAIARGFSVVGGTNMQFFVSGSSAADVVKGVLGMANTFAGLAGTDQLVGGNFADTIDGGTEADKIRGDAGADTLTGGSGADVFKYRNVADSGTGANADTITDFVSGSDRLNFSRIDTNPGLAGDQAFTYIGTAAFNTNGVAKIRYVDLGADLRVEADVNGDGTADMHILLQGAGAGTLTAADFVL